MWEGAWSIYPLSRHATLKESPCVQLSQSSSTDILLGIYGGLITQAWFITSLATGDQLNPSRLPRGQEIELKVPNFSQALVILVACLYPEAIHGLPDTSHLISKKTLITSEIPGVLGTMCQELEQKLCFLLYRNITGPIQIIQEKSPDLKILNHIYEVRLP